MPRRACERVLVVESDPDVLVAIRELLEQSGLVVVSAPPEAAVDSAIRSRVDLILLDVGFHESHRAGVVRRLRSDPRTATLPLILMSTTESVLTSLGPAADATVQKPFTVETLLETLSSFCPEAAA